MVIMNGKFYPIVILLALIAYQLNTSGVFASKNTDENHERTKRSIFLKDSGVSYVVALAVPTEPVDRKRAYMGFNFAASYTLADNDTVLEDFSGDEITKSKRDVHGEAIESRIKHFSDNRNFYTRKNLYRILEKEIDSHGYNGTACLLRMICETSETPFHENNGVFGNIFHILFTPTTSKAEKIRSNYYEAEFHGKIKECYRYLDDCNVSPLDLVSDLISI